MYAPFWPVCCEISHGDFTRAKTYALGEEAASTGPEEVTTPEVLAFSGVHWRQSS